MNTQQASLHRAFQLLQQGQLAPALTLCRQVLAVQPQQQNALLLAGNLAGQLGLFAEAAVHLRQLLALDRASVDGWLNLGNVLRAQAQPHEALRCYGEALARQPLHAEAWHNQGLLQAELGAYPAALHSLNRALQQHPRHWLAWAHRGGVLRMLGRHEEALASYQQAQGIQPQAALVWLGRGLVYYDLRQFELALTHFEQACHLNAQVVEAQKGKADTLRRLGQLDAARHAYLQALQLAPAWADLRCNYGLLLAALGETESARDQLQLGLEQQPDHALIRFNLALCHLLLGDWQQAWPLYEARWQLPTAAGQQRQFAQPQWRGQPLAGKTLLLHSEQGLGDYIQMLRFIPRLAADGARVLLETHAPLSPLLHEHAGLSGLYVKGQPLPAFDYHCPLLSLPLAIDLRPDNLPAFQPYLTAPAARLAHWQTRLPAGDLPWLGLVWRGNPAHSNDANRSLPLSQLLAALPAGWRYLSLQRALPDEELALLQRDGRVCHFGEELHDLADTAALCQLAQQIVSVDTSIAHLAGAMGRPLSLLLPFVSDWRWMKQGEQTPWYGSATLYRQTQPGDWAGVLQRVGHAISRTHRQQDGLSEG